MTPLRLRMIEDMRIRNLSQRTQTTYVEQVARFARHFGKSPELLGPAEIRSWRLHLAENKRLAASSISVTVAALRFLYTVTLRQPWVVEDDIPTGRRPQKLPNVLSPEEVAAFLDAVENQRYRVILTVCYAAGLRVSEAVRLKPAAIDSRRMVIRVEAGKGRKDRYVMLSPRLLGILRDYWETAHPTRAIRGRAGRHPAFFAPCVCSPLAGGRCRSTHHPVAAWSSQPDHDVEISSDRHQQGLRHRQSAGFLARHDAHSAGPRFRLTGGFRGP